MSKFFQHTPQKIGSTTSPTSDLALEVSEAFHKVEGLLDTEGTSLISFKDALGNALFSSIKPHKVTAELSETHTLLENESDIVLENKPDKDDIVVYYLSEDSSVTKTIEKIESNKDFTDVDQYKLLGKVLRLNVRVPKNSSLTLTVDYSTTTFDLNGQKFLPNVIKKDNEEYFIKPSNILVDSFELDYEVNLSDSLDKRINNPQETLHFFYSYDRNTFEELDVTDYSIVDNKILINGNSLPTNLIDLEVITYTSNTSISELVDALVYEFINHDHSNNNISKNISHKDITNRFVNTSKISYKDSEVINYEHPQYLNREGYNPNLDSVYENAFLGDFFVSRIIDEAVQKFKGLDKDSYKIMFGEPTIGPSLKYSYTEEAMLLNSIAPLNSLYIKNNFDDKYVLRLNDTIIKSNTSDRLKIKPEGNTLDIRSDSETKYSVLTDKIYSKESNVEKLTTQSLSINGITIAGDANGKSAIVSGSDIDSILKIDSNVVMNKLNVNELVSENTVSFNKVKTSQVEFKDISFINTADDNVQVISSSDTKKLEITVPLVVKELETPRLTVGDLKPNQITFGDITLGVNADPADNGLVVTNNNSAESTIAFINDVKFNTLSADAITSENNTLSNITAKLIKLGGISLYKTVDNNLTFSGAGNKVIFNTIAQFVDLKAVNSTIDKGIITDLVVDSLKIGEVLLRKTLDNNLSITSSINKVIVGATVALSEVSATSFVSPINTLDRITSQRLTLGKVLLANVDDNIVVSSEINKVIFTAFVEMNKTIINEITSNTAVITDLTADQFKIGDVYFNKTVEEDVVVSSDVNSLIITADTAIDNLTSDIISAESLTATESTLIGLTSENVNIGAVKLAKTLENNLHISSELNKVIIEAPLELANVTSFSNSKINLHSIISKSIKIGNHSFLEMANGDVQLNVSNEARPDSTVTINSSLITKVLKPLEIRGENATGFLNNIEMNILKIGNSKITNYEGKTVIQPTTPEVDKLIINTTTEMVKASIEELQSDEATLTKVYSKNVQVGPVSFREDLEGNALVTATSSDHTLDFQAATKFLKTTIEKAIITLVESKNVISDKVTIGSIGLIKDIDTGDMVLSRVDTLSKIIFDAPAEFNSAKINSLVATGLAKVENLEAVSLNIANFIFKKAEGTNNLIVSSNSQDKFEIRTPMTAQKFTAEIFSAFNYTLFNNDRISIDAENYISNTNNRFEIANTKPISVVGSSRDSGIAFTHAIGARPSYKQYVSANSGAPAVVTEKNVFIETDVSTGVFLLQPTGSKITKDSVVYGFNDSTAQVNISDLTRWFRNDLYIKDLEASAGHFGINEESKKNGISIGDTRISVTGIDTDCPPGLTIFESQDAINFVKPLSANQKGCRDVVYQSLNTGPISVEGIASVDGSLAVTEDIIANGTIGATDISLNGTIEAVDALINGNLDVKGKATFSSDITFKNDIELVNDLNAAGRLKGRSLEVKEDISIGKSISIGEDATVERELTVRGGLNLNSGMTAEGTIKAEALNVENITAQNIMLLRNLEVAGSVEVQGKLGIKSSAVVEGSLTVNNYLDVKDNISTKDIYVLRDAVIKERLTVQNGLEVSGRTISIGSNTSQITLTGKLQLDTTDVKFNSAVYIYENLRITGDIISAGQIQNKGGIYTESSINAKGSITSESTIETESNIIAKTIEVGRNLSVENSISANNITTESISVSGTASVANLNISKSLSMPVDTSIVAGDVRFGSITQTQPSSLNSFAGDLTVAGNVEVLKDLEINQNLTFNNDSLNINSNGISGTDAKIAVDSVKANSFKGSETIQTPNHLAIANNAGANAVGSLIPNKQFARMDYLVCDGIAVFNQAITAETIYYKNLVFAGDNDGDTTGAVNIVARRALYA